MFFDMDEIADGVGERWFEIEVVGPRRPVGPQHSQESGQGQQQRTFHRYPIEQAQQMARTFDL